MKNFNHLFLFTSITVVFGFTSFAYGREKLEHAGIIFEYGSSLNHKIVKATKYVGTCPGWHQEKIIGWFRHKKVPVRKNRRVRIVNETFRDITGKVPYTDRKYAKKDLSGKIGFAFSNHHRKMKFVIKHGTNKFSYMIYDGEYGKSNMQVIKKGNFSIQVKRNVKKYRRDTKWEKIPRFFCYDKKNRKAVSLPLEQCPYPVAYRVGNCAGKYVYSSGWYITRLLDHNYVAWYYPIYGYWYSPTIGRWYDPNTGRYF